MTQRPADGFDGIPRRSNHSSSGTRAMATTSAAVTGMKNSAPALQRERKHDDQADAGDQGQRGEQPVALGGDGFGEHARSSAASSSSLGDACCVRASMATSIMPTALHAAVSGLSIRTSAVRVVPLVRLERTLR